MDTDSDFLWALAALSAEAHAMSAAALDGDLTEARFLAVRVASEASALGDEAIVSAAAQVRCLLGQPGETPRPGIGAAMLQLSDAIGNAV
jgi:hypothetical protein